MADSTENSSNKNVDKVTGRVTKAVSELAETQKYFSNIIDDSLENLTKVAGEYGKIKTEIDKAKAGQLGLYDLSKQLVVSMFDRVKETRKLDDIEKSLSNGEKIRAKGVLNFIDRKKRLEEEYYEAIKENDKDKVSNLREAIEINEVELERKIALLGVQDKMYLAQLQANKLAKQGVNDLLKQTLSVKTVLTTLTSGIKGISSMLGAVTGKGKGFNEMFDSGVDFLKKIPFVGGVIGGIVGGMKSLLDFILEIEDRTVKFGRNLGYSTDQAFQISKQFGNIATGSGKLLLTTENMMEVQLDLSQQLGVNNILTGEMLDTQIELKKVMGLTTDEMGELAKTSIISGKNQKQVVTGVLSQVAGLKAATGISFNYKQIIGEVTKLGGVLGLQFAKYPEKLTKSLLVTKALGMDLGKVDQIAGSLLNFESAIQNQLEAQLITGKDINLSAAQQLALQGDTAGVAMELTKQFGSAGEFLAMNRIQQEAIAKAVGMSREDLADTLKNQEMLTKLGAKETDNNQKKLELALQRYKTEEGINKALGEGAYQNLTALSAQEKMAALIDKVKGALQDFLTKSGVVEWVTGLIHKLTDPENVKGLVNMLKNGVAYMADMIQAIASSLLTIAQAFTFDDEKDQKLADMQANLDSQSMGDKIRSLGGETSGEIKVDDFVIKPMNEDTITMAGGTKLGRTDEMVDLLKQLLNGGAKLGRTDEMVDLLKQLLNETRQGKTMSVNIDGAPLAVAVSRNAPMNYAASNLGPRPLR